MLGVERTTADPRELMRLRLPSWLQWFLTELTGKAHIGQTQTYPWSGYHHLALALGMLVGGVTVGFLSLHARGPWLLLVPSTYLFIIGGARRLQVHIIHQCVHDNFTRYRLVDRVIGELLSIILWVQDFGSYQREHVLRHHGHPIATLDDPDMALLNLAGLQPGMSKSELWHQFHRTLCSPWFHWVFLKARLHANFLSSPPYRRAASIIYLTLLLTVVWRSDAWLAFVSCWLVPITVLYQLSAFVQFTSEHRWGKTRGSSETAIEHYAGTSFGRFLGEPPPHPDMPLLDSLVAWGKWWMGIGFYLIVRVAIYISDVPVHDFHHRHPKHSNWANTLYERQKEIDTGVSAAWPPYSEVWGIRDAIDHVFETLSAAPRARTIPTRGNRPESSLLAL